jgi:hypothetical protein
MLINVYRIETVIEVNGEERTFGMFTAGQYNPSLQMICCEYMNSVNNSALNPKEEGLNYSTDMVCGILDYYQIMSWIDLEMFNKLIDNGFRLAVYEIEDSNVQSSQSQAIWLPEHATYKHNTNLFNLRDLFLEAC